MLIIQKMTTLLHSKAFFTIKSNEDYLRKKLQAKFMNINFFEL